ncbi:MAG: hypothetical protein HXS41_02555 [Theionarchaea archaeon]|nr:hypothetical protein [Theionarchaea archaeon]MBU7001135.1 hypothetical protein [Theionarchaea archaeon]MBU7019914.1 hypothetical protein [Theionarchaea archaeon]MBU7035387.1 hypothetical protein [Theionarchaea archaeon]
MHNNRITVQSLAGILRGKNFTGALTLEKGKVLFIGGSIKLASYKDASGRTALDVMSPLPLPADARVVQLSQGQVELWLKWQELLHDEEELYISPLPDIDKKSLERFFEENELTYLLVHSSTEGG